MTAEPAITGREHWTKKGDVRLFLWEKAAGTSPGPLGTILFVHGSSMASTPTFDLQVPGRSDSSAMDYFARLGYDTWCVDMEGYGRSDKDRPINADIANGADDLEAATDYIARTRGVQSFFMYGVSSGALRAARFTERRPERVRRLALDAFVWTGKGSPTLEQRRKRLPEFQAKNRRPIDRAFVRSIFERDHPGTADDDVIEAFADAILALDDSVPTGTYYREPRRPARLLRAPAELRQAVRRHAGHRARELPSEELPDSLPPAAQLLHPARAGVSGRVRRDAP